MPIRDASRVAGSLQDLTHLLGLPSDDCEVLLVSSRTLYLLANYAVEEVNFTGRYFTETLGANLVRTVEPDGPEVPQVLEIAEAFRTEVIPVTCDLVNALNTIAVAIQSLQLAGCCPPSGENPPQPPTIEADPPPAGYVEYDPMIDERKCKLANMAVDDLLEVIDLLIINDVEAKAALGLAAMSALWNLVVVVLASGPIAWGLAGLGTILGLIGFFLFNSLDLGALKTLVENFRQELVCALYLAPDNDTAFSDFKQVLSDNGADILDLAFIDTLNFLNGLTVLFFAPEGGVGEQIEIRLDGYPITTSCSVCGEPLAPDWVLAPSGLIGVETASGFMGSGTVLNDGTQFVVTSEERSNQAGTYVVGLIVEGFRQSQGADTSLTTAPCVLSGGQITRHDGASSWNALAGRRCTTGSCGAAIGTDQPSASPGSDTGFMFVFYQQTSPFSLTFSIDVPPTECP